MELKYGKALVGALAALTVSIFTVPFCSSATASTGTTVTRHNAGSAIQLAQVEQQETEEKTEQKTKEVQTQTGTDAAGTVVAPAAPVVVAPAAPVPDVSGAVEQKHEESKTTESEHSDNGLSGTSERHENEMSNDEKSAPGSVESEHEEHETKEKVEQN